MLVEATERDMVPARLKVIGIGGCGSNAVGRMIAEGLQGLEFLVVNTDLQALYASPCSNKLQIGAVETRGLGTGGNPTKGRKSAEEDEKTLEDHILGVDMLFITAGMGGGTGTGGAPIVARIARSLDILTVAIVTSPFMLEGRPRTRIADEGIDELRREVDTLIVVPNEKLMSVLDPTTPVMDAYREADEVLYQATRGISELITIKGEMNRDFADVKSVMKGQGNALMGIGVASGEDRAVTAAKQAISNRLLEDVSIEGATAVLVNVAGSEKLGLGELSAAVGHIQDAAGEEAHIFLGNVIDSNLEDEIRVTVVATGFGGNGQGAGGNGGPQEAEETEEAEEEASLTEGILYEQGVEETTEQSTVGQPLATEQAGLPEPLPVGEPRDPSEAVLEDRFQQESEQAPVPATPGSSLPLWKLKGDMARETALLEREPIIPIPTTPAAALSEEGWTQRTGGSALHSRYQRRFAR